MIARRFLSAVLALSALSACDDEAREARRVPEVDPMVQAALDDQLLVDTDLSGRNEANAALTGGFDHALPLPATGEAARQAALDEAQAFLGKSGAYGKLPEAGTGAPLSQAATRSVTVFAREVLGGSACTASMSQDFAWAAKMPADLPVYPRGAVQQAAGADHAGCAARAVDFRTPVARDDVLEFYNAAAIASGYRTALTRRGPDTLLDGRKTGARFVMRTRKIEGELTEVDLATRSE